ncbi:MAG: energy transducer TonB [Microbacter sp.]
MIKKSEAYGYIGTTLFAVLLFLLFWLVKLPFTQNSYNEPIYINLGNSTEGGGVELPQEAAAATASEKSQITPQHAVNHENLMTQVDESPVSVPNQIKQTKKKPIPNENQEKVAAQKMINQAFQRAQAEKQKAEQEAINKAQKLGSLFGKDQGQGAGNTQGSGVQGNPLGTVGGNANGISASVAGRSPLYIPTPSYQSNDEGTVTVHVVVDREGSVTNAYIGASTTTSQSLRNAALEAAKKSKFSKGDHDAIGTIVYHFILH